MKIQLVLTSVLLTVSSITVAESFRNEIELGLGTVSENDFDYDAVGVSYTHYFDDVNTTNVPRAEAGFLSKTHAINVNYVSTSSDPDIVELSAYDAEGKYFLADTGFFIGAQYQRAETDFNADFFANITRDISAETEVYSLVGGYFLTDSTSLSVKYGAQTTEIDDLNTEVDSDLVTVDLKTVVSAFDSQWFMLESQYSSEDPEERDRIDTVYLGADYYFSTKLSFGLNYEVESTDGDDTSSYGVRGSYFLMPNVEITGEYTKIETDEASFDSEAYLLSAAYRF